MSKSVKAPEPPEQCKVCINFNSEDMICSLFEELPGEGSRKEVKSCSSFYDNSQKDDLKILAEYVREDPNGLVEQRIQEAVDNVLGDYENTFKVMVVGIARRKIKSMVKMVDIIDILLDKLTDIDQATITDMTPNQTIRLLSDLNQSVNNDLSFIMKLLQADSSIKDIQMYIDNSKSVNIMNTPGSAELSSDDLARLTGTSRDKIRDAFDAILHNLDVPELEEVHEQSEEDLEELTIL